MSPPPRDRNNSPPTKPNNEVIKINTNTINSFQSSHLSQTRNIKNTLTRHASVSTTPSPPEIIHKPNPEEITQSEWNTSTHQTMKLKTILRKPDYETSQVINSTIHQTSTHVQNQKHVPTRSRHPTRSTTVATLNTINTKFRFTSSTKHTTMISTLYNSINRNPRSSWTSKSTRDDENTSNRYRPHQLTLQHTHTERTNTLHDESRERIIDPHSSTTLQYTVPTKVSAKTARKATRQKENRPAMGVK